jgi:hypothetical protein
LDLGSDFDFGAQFRRHIRANPETLASRQRLQARYDELVSPTDEGDLFDYIRAEYAAAVAQIALNGCLRVYRELQERSRPNGTPAASEHDTETEDDISARLRRYLDEDPYWHESRANLTDVAVELIPESDQRAELIEYATDNYAYAVLDVALSACVAALRQGDEHELAKGGDATPGITERIEMAVRSAARPREQHPG